VIAAEARVDARAPWARRSFDAWAEAALVVAGEGPLRERIVTDLVVLGYRPLLGEPFEPPPEDPRPTLVVILAAEPGADAAGPSKALRTEEGLPGVPIVWLLPPDGLGLLRGNEQLCDDFLTVPYGFEELAARLRLLRWRTGREGPDVIRRGPLSLNTATYQATLAGRNLDLTYMEYELLKLLMSHPGRVFTREAILARVWRYDYFGGLRTVDVHVRRLRAKLGQDHAGLIETVRGVGYRFAQLHH
jgi:DNA-binding response OmpR family regulator